MLHPVPGCIANMEQTPEHEIPLALWTLHKSSRISTERFTEGIPAVPSDSSHDQYKAHLAPACSQPRNSRLSPRRGVVAQGAPTRETRPCQRHQMSSNCPSSGNSGFKRLHVYGTVEGLQDFPVFHSSGLRHQGTTRTWRSEGSAKTQAQLGTFAYLFIYLFFGICGKDTEVPQSTTDQALGSSGQT